MESLSLTHTHTHTHISKFARGARATTAGEGGGFPHGSILLTYTVLDKAQEGARGARVLGGCKSGGGGFSTTTLTTSFLAADIINGTGI
jgi:hypothetical protein